MNKKILIVGSIFGLLAIVLGAFAAHGLKTHISVEFQQTFETGVRYQMYHALFLLFIGNYSGLNKKTTLIIFYLVVFGVVLFSGSLYGLATQELSGFNFRTIGFITPIGGFLLIAAWFILLIKFVKTKTDKS